MINTYKEIERKGIIYCVRLHSNFVDMLTSGKGISIQGFNFFEADDTPMEDPDTVYNTEWKDYINELKRGLARCMLPKPEIDEVIKDLYYSKFLPIDSTGLVAFTRKVDGSPGVILYDAQQGRLYLVNTHSKIIESSDGEGAKFIKRPNNPLLLCDGTLDKVIEEFKKEGYTGVFRSSSQLSLFNSPLI